MKFIKYLFIFSLVSFVAVLGISIFFKNPKPIVKQQIIPSAKQPTTTPTPDNRCIITIYGQKYNITNYINQHKGGDVFNCGTDMSGAFANQHPDSFLQQIAKYKVN
jgi:hypothetical protein